MTTINNQNLNLRIVRIVLLQNQIIQIIIVKFKDSPKAINNQQDHNYKLNKLNLIIKLQRT